MAAYKNPALIQQTLAGNHAAFGLLVERYGAAVYARIARRVRDPDDVDDLVQDVFLTAYSRLDQIKDRGRFPAWLNTIADNRVRQWHRRRYVQLRWEAMFHAARDGDRHDADEAARTQELSMMLRRALLRLSEAQRQVIVHHYLKGYSYRETAWLLGLEVDTVRSRLQKARHRLKTEVQSMDKRPHAQQQTYALIREDLTVLRWAAAFASKDPERPSLQGVYLDTGGRIVATDGFRLLMWPSDRLRAIAMPVLLGAWHEMEVPDTERGTLSIGEYEAVIRASGMPDHTAPVMEAEKFPRYEKVIPAEWTIRIRVATEKMRELIDLLTNHLDHLSLRHPVGPIGHFLYRPLQPQVEMRIAMADQTLSLFTDRAMGYFASAREYKSEKPPAEGPDWTFIASVPVEIDTTEAEDRFRIGVDFAYLRDAFRVLEIDRSETLLARFIDPEKAMIFSPAERPDRQVLVMPLRMTPDEG